MTSLAFHQAPPSVQDAALARASGQMLARFSRKNRPPSLRVQDNTDAPTIDLPTGAVNLLMDILEAMAAGRGVTLIPQNAELTTVQAAEILNVSRPFLIKLLESKEIPYRKVGKHRRVKMEDVMAYKDRIDKERESILDALVADAQENNMGY